MSCGSTGKLGAAHSDERYAQQILEQKGIPRKKLTCPFCSKVGGEGNMHRWHFAKCKSAPITATEINGFDCDGVIYLGPNMPGIYPGPNDVIITGRSFEEEPETKKMLLSRGILNKVYYNKLTYDQKTRITSGEHKGETIWQLFCSGTKIVFFYEDDWDQFTVIKKIIKKYALSTQLIWINHNGLVELENRRQDEL